MTINLKTILLASSFVAVGLNVVQFVDSALQRKDAFSPSWAYADKSAAGTSAGSPKRTVVSPSPQPAAPATSISTVPATPAGDTVTAVATKLAANGLRSEFAALYLDVQGRTGTPWQLLAAVHKVETGQRGDTTVTSYAGAQGPMQFMPATWRRYGGDGDRNGTTDIHDVDDAVLAAGHYLAAGGATRGQYSTALYHYNHSWSYVSKVTGIARKLGLSA
jgi:membrane-bound lytic murein transglycosylase B